MKLTQASRTKEIAQKEARKTLESCLREGNLTWIDFDNLQKKIRRETAHEFEAGKGKIQEQRRVEWTSFHNLQRWFDTFELQLLTLGFAREKNEEEKKMNIPEVGSVIIEAKQREQILTLDGTEARKGGRPPTIFYAKDVSSAGVTPANKSGYSATFIGGSTASGTPFLLISK